MRLRTGSFTAFPLAILLLVAAGCSSNDTNPTAPPTTTGPAVIATNPGNGATGVAVITASFNMAMAASSISATTFTLTAEPSATPVPGSVVYNVTTYIATFIPTSALTTNTGYMATITTGATDVAGNPIANNYVWNFTTAATSGSQTSVALGNAVGFAVLAGSTVTSTGATALTGDLGVSPGAAVTGFPPGTFSGAKHAADATSALAMADLTTAYNDAAGRTLAPVTVAGNLGGLTLPPGLYKSTSSLEINSGDLTLDAQGNANAVFIFQIASTLTTTSGRAVFLTGGAQASNVFWQVGTSATLGTTSVFKGTIMADQAISLLAGAVLDGRALARIAGVTLSGNTVKLP